MIKNNVERNDPNSLSNKDWNEFRYKGGRIAIKLVVPDEVLFPSYTGQIARAAILNYINDHNKLLADSLNLENKIST